LKTNGYRRTDLYLLFGLEAGMLGLIGGALGAGAATGVSYLVRNLVQQTFGLNIPFLLDPTTILGGVLIGLLTSLIFGLLPIVQAANIRPLNVIRELPEGNRTGSIALTIGMLIILSVLFCALAIFILNNDVTLGLISVYGTFIFLGLLSLFFGLVVFIISILPVPERFSAGYLALVITATVLSGLLCLILPAFGALLLIVSLMGFVIVLLPRTWKATTKMALRNIGRQRARTTTTMLALFVGIFTIGLILVLGQDLRDTVNNAISKSLDFNVIALMSSANGDKLQSQLSTIPGLKASRHTQIASAAPVAIDGKPIQTLLPKSGSPGSGTLGREGALQFLRGVEGYDVGNNQLPDPSKLPIRAGGRSLTANDAGTNNILAPSLLATLGPLHLKLNDTITLVSVDGKTIKTLTIVGFYNTSGFNTDNFEPLIGSADLAKSLSPAGLGQSAFYMKLDTALVSKGVEKIGNIVPDAFVLNLANITNIIDQILNDVLLTLTTIASLSLLAGVIIIANAVALAMLERRRELGILKSVGYTSGSILSEVLIENGVIGGTGALLAMLLVTLATTVLAQYVFKIPLNVAWEIALALIVGSAILAMLTSILVAWTAVRVRPLEVLRYE
ncbi:MAG TPA: FtsX-like permease family protein, partial [Ktedonobacteraceae bacterium]|nr:FtsX-like permease family protein [Ktedonobacteraceae bacterium]